MYIRVVSTQNDKLSLACDSHTFLLWTILCSLNVYVYIRIVINMNGHLTFLEWTVIMAVCIYLTIEVIVYGQNI